MASTTCPTCQGTGGKGGQQPYCPTCQGTGKQARKVSIGCPVCGSYEHTEHDHPEPEEGTSE